MRINNFLQHIKEAAKMSALKEPTDQEIEEAEKYLQKGVDPDWDNKLGYFYIDVSGKYSVYYTFWRFNPTSKFNMCHYISNLSTDFKTAIEKAKKAAGRIPIIIDRYGTQAGLFQATKAEIITFGKHRGKTLGEIFVEDPQYIQYLYKNDDQRNSLRSERIKYFYNLYLETITKKNLEESKSEFVGKIGETITIDADVYGYSQGVNDFGSYQYSCKLVDENGNKYSTYNIGKELKNGDSVTLTAKVKDHKELLGVKFTTIYYCKVSKVSNRVDDMNKYNL